MTRQKSHTPQRVHEIRDRSEGPQRKTPLFDWDDIGLGLNMDVSSRSATSSEHSDSPNVPEVSFAKLNFPNPYRAGMHRPTYTWVKKLTEMRMALRHCNMDDKLVARKYAKPGCWLHDQIVELKAGTIPVTFKCVLAASAISQAFIDTQDQFKKPEYRTRYWNWSVNFLTLIDFLIDHGNLDIPADSTEYVDALSFIRHSKTQKDQGTLSLQREQLLTALGLVWDVAESEELSDHDSSEESEEDENWVLPVAKPAPKKVTKPKAKPKPKSRTKKRKRSTTVPTSNKSKATTAKRSKVDRSNAERIDQPLSAWARNFKQIRTCYTEGRGYDHGVLDHALYNWMKSEVTKCRTGLLGDECTAIMKYGGFAYTYYIGVDSACAKWCQRYVEYLDFILRFEKNAVAKSKAPKRVSQFLYDCRLKAEEGILSKDRDDLLKGIEKNWQKSSIARGPTKSAENGTGRQDYHHETSEFIPGHVVEVVLDSGRNADRRTTGRKKRRNIVCQQMLSSMIRGIIGESVEGRSRTLAEKDAEEWVTRVDARTLNNYAKNWFKTASVE